VIPGPNIEGYRILERIGGGTTGDVYRAVQVKMDREVALKVLPSVLSSDPRHMERFQREVQALARLRHENIVTALDAGESSGHCFLVMEFVRGNTLAHIIERGGALDERRVGRIGLQMAHALDHACRHNLIHRDIKPQNIILSFQGMAKLCDMGFAHLAASPLDDSPDGLTLGTPAYISPEQAKGQQEVDIRSDIYSLGATLYHALTGSVPFQGRGAAEVMMKHIIDYVVPPHEKDEIVSEEISYIVKKMMRKEPEKRYQKPRILIADLQSFLEGTFQAPANWFSDSSLNLRAQRVKPEEEEEARRARKNRSRRLRKRKKR